MLTTSIAAGVAKVLASQFLEHVGVDQDARRLLQVPIDQLFGRAERRAAASTIEKLATVVAQDLLAFPRALEDNQGAAASAADTLLSTLRASELSPSKLVELDLDASRLKTYLLLNAESLLRGASTERRGHVERAINTLSLQLIAGAPSLPGVQLAFMQAMLRSRGKSEA